jgi:class 3 adenylate cyclase
MACPALRALNPARQKFCDACGASLAAAPARRRRRATPRRTPRGILSRRSSTTRSALEGERKHVSVLFADVVDSMRLAEGLDAEEWHRILDRVFDILARGVHRFEGTINPVHR